MVAFEIDVAADGQGGAEGAAAEEGTAGEEVEAEASS